MINTVGVINNYQHRNNNGRNPSETQERIKRL